MPEGFDLLPLPCLSIDPDGKIANLNAAILQVLSPDFAFSAVNIIDIIHPEDRGLFQLHVARQKLHYDPARDIDIRIQKDGQSTTWMAARITDPRKDRHILVTLFDIEQRKKRENEAAMWEHRWNSALVSSGLGVWDHDIRRSQFYYSRTWRQLRGLDPEAEVNGDFDVWLENVHPEDRARVTDFIEKQNAGDPNAVYCEYRERHRDGHYVWIACRGSCVERDEFGRPARIVGTDLDITDRKEFEERLAHVSRRLALVLEVTQIGVFEADLTDGTLLLDDQLLKIYDMQDKPNLQAADDWETVLHPDDREAAKRRIESNLRNNTNFSNEFRIVRKDGSIRHLRARAALFTDSAGHQKIIGANWDVTDDIVIREELEHAKTLAEARNRELELTKARIEHNALHDFLTELPNRRFLDEMLALKANDKDCGLSILHIDLDRFKQINDTLGHQAGDFMLLHAAKVLRECAGPGDFVARIGGDEFVVVSDYSGNRDELGMLAEKIISRMCEPVYFKGIPCRIGASIGIAFETNIANDSKHILQNADIALYRAKSKGRNRYEFFAREIQFQVINAKRVSDEILASLDRGDFEPHYQLQFYANGLDIAGAETLARWHHPERGILTPDAFLDIAEDLDVVDRIDSLILEKAMRDMALLRIHGIDIPKVSTNVSARRLSDPQLIDNISKLHMVPGTLSFELLESIFLDDCDEAVAVNLQGLRALGIELEIDDFGSGHASIMSLLRIAPSTLKIDRALIMPITQGRDARNLVSSIIGIGKSLNIKVVAEGVETGEHIKILQELGCDILQGYALSRPMKLMDLIPFTRERCWMKSAL